MEGRSSREKGGNEKPTENTVLIIDVEAHCTPPIPDCKKNVPKISIFLKILVAYFIAIVTNGSVRADDFAIFGGSGGAGGNSWSLLTQPLSTGGAGSSLSTIGGKGGDASSLGGGGGGGQAGVLDGILSGGAAGNDNNGMTGGDGGGPDKGSGGTSQNSGGNANGNSGGGGAGIGSFSSTSGGSGGPNGGGGGGGGTNSPNGPLGSGGNASVHNHTVLSSQYTNMFIEGGNGGQGGGIANPGLANIYGGSGGQGGGVKASGNSLLVTSDLILLAGQGGDGGGTFEGIHALGGHGGAGGGAELSVTGTLTVNGAFQMTSGVNGINGTADAGGGTPGNGGLGGAAKFTADSLSAPTINLTKKDGSFNFQVDTLEIAASGTVLTATGLAVGDATIGTLLLTNDQSLTLAGSGVTLGNFKMDGGILKVVSGSTFIDALTFTTPGIVLGTAGGTFDTNGQNYSRSDTISGSGGVTKNGSGTLTLSGVSTFTGATTISSGSLALSGGGSIASSTGVTVADHSVFDIQGITPTSASVQSLSGAGEVVLGAKNMTVGGGSSSTFSGVISGVGGSFAKTGTSVLTLSGANTFTGGTTVSSGKIIVQNVDAFGAGGVEIESAGTVETEIPTFGNQLTGTGTLAVNRASAVDAFAFGAGVGNAFTGAVEMQRGNLLLDANAATALSLADLKLNTGGGATVDADRTIHSLTMNGGTLKFDVTTIGPNGVLTVMDLNTTGGGTIQMDVNKPIDTSLSTMENWYDYADRTSAKQHRLVAATTVVGDGTLLDWRDYQGNALGTGQMRDLNDASGKIGTATFDYAGSVVGTGADKGIFLGYTLTQLEADAGKTLVLDSTGATGTVLNAKLTGAGGFMFSGTTNVSVGNAASDYTGTTQIDGSHTVTMLTNNAFGNTSSLGLTNAAKLDMNGKSQTVDTATIATGTELTLGDLTVTQGGEIAGALKGGATSNLRLAGGTTNMTGDSSTFAGTVRQSAGTVNLDSALRLGGTFDQTAGTLNSLDGATLNTATFKGTVNPTGRLTILNDAVFDGATINVDLDNGGSIAASQFTNTGNAAVVATKNADTDLVKGQVNRKLFTFLEGAGADSFAASFASINSRIKSELFADTDSLGFWLWLAGYRDEYGNRLSPNGNRMAGLIDTLPSGNGFRAALDSLTDDAAILSGIENSTGEIYGMSMQGVTNLQRVFNESILARKTLKSGDQKRVILGQCDPCSPVCGKWSDYELWGMFTGGSHDRSSVGRSSGYDLSNYGVALGVERKLSARWFGGVAFGYDNANQSLDSRYSKDEFEAFRASLYGGYAGRNWYASGYAGYAKNWHDVRRNNPVLGFGNRGKYDDDVFSTGLELGKIFRTINGARFIPSVGIHWIHLDSPEFTERGDAASALQVSKSYYDSVRLPIGARLNRTFTTHSIAWTPEVRAFYVAELADTRSGLYTAFASAAGAGSVFADSGDSGRNGGIFGTGVMAQLTSRLSVGIDYDYEIWEHYDRHNLTGNVTLRW